MLMSFFMKLFYFKIHIAMYISVGVQVYFSCKKEEFDRFFDWLKRLVEESRPDR